MRRIDWIAKLRHLLQTLAFCMMVAAIQLAFNPDRGYTIPLTYSCCIGVLTWMLIDFGLHLFPSARETGWPQGPSAILLPVVSLVIGYGLGTFVADSIFGFATWSARARPRLVGTLLISLLAGIVAIFYFYSLNRGSYFQRRLREAQSHATEARLKLLESQLEPHMLFNTLANLRVLIGLDPPRAQAMLDRLIAFLRSTLDASRSGAHPVAAEFERLSDYLALMAVRMGPRLQVTLDLPDALKSIRRCCCSPWSRTPSGMAWSPRSPAAASRSGRAASASSFASRCATPGSGSPRPAAPRARASACSRCATAWRHCTARRRR